MENNKKKITKWFYWFLFALAVIVVYKVVDNFSGIGNWIKNFLDVLMPFLIGILIAYLLYMPSRKLEGIIIGIITSIAMSILNVKYSVLLGFMIGIFNLIPYFGAIIFMI